MNISLKTLRVLTLLEQGPKYGRQFAVIAPELFWSDSMVNLAAAKNGNGGSVPLQNIYILLNQAKKHGFVEELKAFKPSAREIEEDAKALQRKYYGITVSGRKALIDARKLVTKI